MPNDKVLSRLKQQIRDLQPLLEQFGDESIQPTADDCEKLQRQICIVQENLSVFKYQKQNHEVSPSFNIHARVSEEVKTEEKIAPPSPVSETVPEEKKSESKFSSLENGAESKLPAPIAVAVNDKFRFINELFAQNPAEYNIAMEQLSSLQNWAESELYISSLKSLYAWKDNQDVVKQFYSLIKRRFE